MLIKKTKKKEEEKKRRHPWAWRKREGVEERREEKKRDVDVFYIRRRRKRKRKIGPSVVKWDVNNLLMILAMDVIDRCNSVDNYIGINEMSSYFLALF